MLKGRLIAATGVALTAAGAAGAGGLDRSGQPVDVIFKDGNYAEIELSRTLPEVGGDDVPQGPPGFPPGFDTGVGYDGVADAFNSVSGAVKYDINERVSIAIIGAEDYGSDIFYDEDPQTSLLGGTEAIADSYAISVVGRYKFTENFSVHGGVRADRADGEVTLNGLAYGGTTQADPATGQVTGGGVSGYNVEFDNDIGYGYLAGAAFEIPDIALRIAVTYFSPIEHDFDTTESIALDFDGDNVPDARRSVDTGTTEVEAPQAVNVDFQTGIAPDTLLFGGVRWAEWSEFLIEPDLLDDLTGSGLVELDDVYTYTLGVGRQFTDQFSASAAFIYEDPNDRLVSPLAPSTGLQAVALGAAYRIDQIEIAGGVRYSWLGDSRPETGTPDVARADFDQNSVVSVGVRLGYYF